MRFGTFTKSLLFTFLIILSGCAQQIVVPPTVVNILPDYRWMDRELYFALPDGSSPDRNNVFQKNRVKTALNEIQLGTSLGEGYFTYQEVDEALLQPSLEATVSSTQFKSFILIWPDNVFNDFVTSIGGVIPDPNTITVINSAYKRKFFIIIKSSCFVTSSACGNISQNGLSALIARQFGYLVGMKSKDCAFYQNNVMCRDPSNTQWSSAQKGLWFSALNNVLESILNNVNYYSENVPQAGGI